MFRVEPSDRRPLVITGWGLVSPLGHAALPTFRALCDGRVLTDRATDLPADLDPVDLVRALGCVSTVQHTRIDPVVELAERAAREALMMAGALPREVACVVGASKGAVHALSAAVQRLAKVDHVRAEANPPARSMRSNRLSAPPPVDAPLAVVLGPHGYLGHHLERRLGVRSPYLFTGACASGLTALHQVRLMIRHGSPPPEPPEYAPPGPSPPPLGTPDNRGKRKILVLSADASLVPVLIHGYGRLGVLAPLTTTGYRARPMAVNRCGFVLAEMAAAVVIEPRTRVGPGQIELVDTATASESYDLVRPAPGMPGLSRVTEQLLADRPIDVIHPHAPGTVANDRDELAVYTRHLRSTPDYYACKGALGHGLGASGLVALVVACMCAVTGRRPPMPWLREPIVEELSPETGGETGGRAKPIGAGCQAVFSAGFGGQVAGAVIRGY